VTVFLTLLLVSGLVRAEMNGEVVDLQRRWAEVNYQLVDEARLAAFEALVSEAESVTDRHPDSAEAWIWSGIIKSTYAGAKGGLGALSLAKASRKELERAMQLDDLALSGSAYTSLGALYYSVPGWPVGFGNNKMAEELLTHALQIAPESIDANYFYAEYLRNRKDFSKAREYYLKALSAAPRPGREIADQGRRGEIKTALDDLQ
jgi:tetratricopeptide (TPR) repeat protein